MRTPRGRNLAFSIEWWGYDHDVDSDTLDFTGCEKHPDNDLTLSDLSLQKDTRNIHAKMIR